MGPGSQWGDDGGRAFCAKPVVHTLPCSVTPGWLVFHLLCHLVRGAPSMDLVPAPVRGQPVRRKSNRFSPELCFPCSRLLVFFANGVPLTSKSWLQGPGLLRQILAHRQVMNDVQCHRTKNSSILSLDLSFPVFRGAMWLTCVQTH